VGRTVAFHRLAAKEARAAEAWYASRSPETAVRFRAAVVAASNRIAADGISHPIASTRFRYVPVHRFPYRLIFLNIDSETTRVIAVSHHRRRPGYWRRRL
jgi:hypothetical protein